MNLFAFERRWLLVVFDTILPPDSSERLSLGARSVNLEPFVIDLFRSAPLHFTLGVRACLWLLMLAPVWLLGELRWFSRCAEDKRAEILDRMAESDVYLIRELPLLMKTTACLGFCGLPEVQSGIGIPSIGVAPPEWHVDASRRLPMAPP